DSLSQVAMGPMSKKENGTTTASAINGVNKFFTADGSILLQFFSTRLLSQDAKITGITEPA
ncbi:hypothetical protein OFN45_33665, partial [Escherichia coli]|nr:hypothetical protein [Escherichia coli]